MFSIKDLNIEELDSFSPMGELYLNKAMMGYGFTPASKIVTGYDMFIKFYKNETLMRETGSQVITSMEKNVIFQYKTKDMITYVLDNVTKEQVTREVVNLPVEELIHLEDE